MLRAGQGPFQRQEIRGASPDRYRSGFPQRSQPGGHPRGYRGGLLPDSFHGHAGWGFWGDGGDLRDPFPQAFGTNQGPTSHLPQRD